MKEFSINKDKVRNFVIIWIIGFLTHLYIFTNKFYNEDDINNLISKVEQTSLGRWLDDFLFWLLPTESIPMINGPLAISFLVIAAILVCQIFEIENSHFEILIGCIFVTFPVFACNFTWMIGAHRYAIAILLAVLFVYFLVYKDFKGHTVVAGVCLILSLGLYQIYLCLAMGIFWIWVIKYTTRMYLKDKDSFGAVIKKIVGYFLCAVIAVALYGLITKIVLLILGVSFTSYQNMNKIFDVNIFDYFIGMLKTYYRTIMFFIGGLYGTPSFYVGLVNILILLFTLYIVWKVWKQNKQAGNVVWKIIILFEVTLLPAFIESIEIMAATAHSRHMIMRFGSVLWYIAPVIILDKVWKNRVCLGGKVKNFLYALAVIIVCLNIYICNLAYFKCSLTTQNLESLLNRVAFSIEQTEGFVPNETKVWIDSGSGIPLYTSNQEDFEMVSNMIGISDQYRFFELQRLKSIMENFLYFQSEDPTDKEIEEIKNTEAYAKMNAYPLKGSIEWINGVLVVKMAQ